MARKSAAAERGPTERQRAAAALVARGRSMEDAMLEAGYGAGAVAGLKGDFLAFLQKLGLDTAPAARPPRTTTGGEA